MKITKLTSMCVRSEVGRKLFMVRVDTDAGIYGLGEVGKGRWGKAIEQAVAQFSEILVGEDPFATERLWQHMFRGSFNPADGVYSCAISAIDIALWDIKGKALKMPVYKLLGGPVRDKVVCYPHTQGKDIKSLVDNCRRAVDSGWKFVRFDVPETNADGNLGSGGPGTLDPVRAVGVCRDMAANVREAVGPDIQICIDAHTRLDTAHAATLFRLLEPYNPFFIEDALRSEGPESYRTLARQARLPIAAGEQWSSKWQFRTVIEEELISYARIDVCNVGGLTESLKITHACETHYIDIAPHNPLGPVSAAACVTLCMASTNVGVQEMPKQPGTMDRDLFPVQVGWKDGYAFCGDVPGLGVDIDMAVAESRRAEPGGWTPLLRRSDGAFTNW